MAWMPIMSVASPEARTPASVAATHTASPPPPASDRRATHDMSGLTANIHTPTNATPERSTQREVTGLRLSSPLPEMATANASSTHAATSLNAAATSGRHADGRGEELELGEDVRQHGERGDGHRHAHEDQEGRVAHLVGARDGAADDEGHADAAREGEGDAGGRDGERAAPAALDSCVLGHHVQCQAEESTSSTHRMKLLSMVEVLKSSKTRSVMSVSSSLTKSKEATEVGSETL